MASGVCCRASSFTCPTSFGRPPVRTVNNDMLRAEATMRRRFFLAGSTTAAALASFPVIQAETGGNFIQFPRNFIWGVASSAFQIEGGLNTDGRGVGIWDDVVADNSSITAEPAADHYRRWQAISGY